MPNKQEIINQTKQLWAETRKDLNRYKYWRETGVSALALFLWVAGVYGFLFSAPALFPKDTVTRINKNSSISQVGALLHDKEIIRSEFIFKVLAHFSDSGKVVAGDYSLEKRDNIFTLVRRVTRGEYGIDPIKITVMEGLNTNEIAQVLAKRLPIFDKAVFLELATKEEGRLYPDTYFIKPADDETDMVKMMTDNFDKQIKEIELQLLASNKNLNEILTMASIIELEAKTPETRRMVSGILWNRIKNDMKLQVDAVFPYIMNKYSLQLTHTDLQFDSPYNTYKYKGLPPGPVGNPGIDSIKAAISPTKTSYLYYLSDREGKMYYAKTYAEHMANRRKYIGE